MITVLLAAKTAFLLLAVAFSVPVLIGGLAHGDRVTTGQSGIWAVGVTGFITLQWLI